MMGLRFGRFEVDTESGELRKDGEIVKIAEKPQQALLLLLERAGHIVSREDLQQRLWPTDTFVEFEDNLNATIKRLRQALDDSAVRPQFIETIPRRGYRFAAPVQQIKQGDRSQESGVRMKPAPAGRLGAKSSGVVFSESPTRDSNPRRFAISWVAAACIGVVLALFASLGLMRAVGGRRSAQPHGQRLVAVAPVANLTNGVEPPFPVDGLTDDLIARLGRLSPQNVAVIGRTSAFRVPGNRTEILGADYLLTSELKSGDTGFQLDAHLIRSRDRREVWAARFRFPLQETIFGVLVARHVAEALNVPRGIENRTDLSHAQTSDLAAYQAYLCGLSALQQGNKSAAGYFDESLRHDPRFALPLAGRARGYMLHPESRAQAEAAIEKGIAMDSSIADFYSLRADLLVTSAASHDKIEADYRHAIELDPNRIEALEHYALYLRERRPAEALQYIERARVLDPLSPSISANSGWVLISAGKFSEAYERLQSTLRQAPEFPPALLYLGNLQIKRAHSDEAIPWFEKAASASGRDPQYLFRLARVYAEVGREPDVRRLLTELREKANSGEVKPQMIRALEAMIGDPLDAGPPPMRSSDEN